MYDTEQPAHGLRFATTAPAAARSSAAAGAGAGPESTVFRRSQFGRGSLELPRRSLANEPRRFGWPAGSTPSSRREMDRLG